MKKREVKFFKEVVGFRKKSKWFCSYIDPQTGQPVKIGTFMSRAEAKTFVVNNGLDLKEDNL